MSRQFALRHAPLILLVLLIALMSAVTASFALTRFYELKSGGYDVAIFNQLLSNITQGNGFISTIAPPHIAQHWFGVHFSPSLYLIAPLYALFSYAETLQLLQPCLIMLAAVPIFYAVRRLLPDWQALLVAIFYLINPHVINAAISDFHEIALAPLVIAAMLWAVLAQSRRWLLAGTVILIGIKEHYGLAVIGFGLLWAWQWRGQWRFGLNLALAGLFVLISVLFVIMPHYSPASAPAMMSTGSSIDRFSWIFLPFAEDSPLAAIIVDGIFYLFQLFAVFWFLPLRALAWLLPGTADLAVNILSTNLMLRSVGSYHSVALMPVVTVAFAVAVSRHYTQQTRLKRTDILIATTAIYAWFVSLATLPIFPENNIWELSTPKLGYSEDDAKARAAINAMVPQSASISAQDNMPPHLSPRRYMYHFPERVKDADFVLLHTGFPFSGRHQVFDSPYSVSGEEYFAAAFALLKDGQWGVARYDNGWLLLKRGLMGCSIVRHQARKDLANSQLQYKKIKSEANS